MNYMCMPGIPPNRSPKRGMVVSKVSRDIIIETVCAHFGIELKDIQVVSRKRPIVYRRQLLMYFLVNLTSETYKEIGGLFGMDHTSVIHSKDQIKNLLTVDEMVQSDVESIKRKIIDAHY